MKRVKVLALLAAMVMLLSACNVINITKVATVGDLAVSKAEYTYFLEMAKSEAFQVAQSQGNTIAKDEDWNTVMIDGKSAAQYAKDKALEQAKKMLILEAKGKAAGYVMTDDDQSFVKEKKDETIAQLGGKYGYEQALKEMGISMEEFNTVMERTGYATVYASHIMAEDASISPAEELVKEKYNNEYIYVRHILIPIEAPMEDVTIEGEEAPAESVDYAEEAKKTAEEVLKKVAAGSDFVALMNEYSGDTRDEENKLTNDGYIMKNDGSVLTDEGITTMVKEFEDASLKLEVGAYTTELVETQYGYHIIKRYALPQEGEKYEKQIQYITSEIQTENLEKNIDAWAGELGFSVNEKFVSKLKIKMEG